MNPWDLWVWPWTATMEAWRRALDIGEAETAIPSREAEAQSARTGPEWSTVNRLTLDIAALRLRDFSTAVDRFPVLVVTPFSRFTTRKSPTLRPATVFLMRCCEMDALAFIWSNGNRPRRPTCGRRSICSSRH